MKKLKLLAADVEDGLAGGEEFVRLMSGPSREYLARSLSRVDVVAWFNQTNLSRVAVSIALWNAVKIAESEGR